MSAPISKRRPRHWKILRATYSVWERLESRRLLTANLYVDFGDSFPAAGLQMTVKQLRDTFSNGGIQGPDLRPETRADTSANYVDSDTLTYKPFNPLITFDYNGDGSVNAQDATDLRNNVLWLIKRYYSPLDVNVQTAAASSVSDIINTLKASGHNDAYVLCDAMTPVDSGEFGIASGFDIGSNNSRPDSANAYADIILGTFAGPQADTALAYTTTHEPGHTFSLQHTNNGSISSDDGLLTQSDLIVGSAGNANRTNFDFFTRYPLPTDSGSPATYSPYLQLANDPNVGTKPGAPAYVTGTGAWDKITLTSGGGTTVNVSVGAYRDSGFVGEIGSDYTYTIDDSNGILIETGIGDDQVTINANINANITVHGMKGNDQLIVLGDGASSGSYTPGTAAVNEIDGNTYYSGKVVAGGTTINMGEYQLGGAVSVQGITNFSFVSPNSNDVLTEDSPSAGADRISGTSGGVGFVPLTFTNVSHFTVDTGSNDGASPNDSVTLQAAPATGLLDMAVNTGAGDDTLNVDFSSANPVPSGGLSYNGGTGTGDRLVLHGGSFANETYTPTGPGSGSVLLDSSDITYSNLSPIDDTTSVTNAVFNATAGADVINLVNGAIIGGAQTAQINSGNGTFELVNFANKQHMTIEGQTGADVFNLSASVAPTGLADLVVDGQNSSNTGDDAAIDTFNVSNTIVPTTLNGGAGADIFNITGTGAGSTLVANGQDGNDSFAISGTGAGSTLSANGQDGNDGFTITGSGAGSTITAGGQDGDDTFNVTGAGLGSGSVNLNGDNGSDTFNVTASANATINITGGAAADILNLDGSTNTYDISSSSATASGQQPVNYTAVETLAFTDGTFNVPGVVTEDVVVNNGATLIGNGAITGSVTSNAGGTISPGISGPGILGSGNLVMNASSTYSVDLNGTTPGTQSDQLNVTGNVTLNTPDLTGNVGYSSIPGDEIVIIHNAGVGTVTGKFAQGDMITIGGQKFAIDYNYDADGDLQYNDVALIRYGAALAPDPCDPTQMALYVSATTGNDNISVVPVTGNSSMQVFINSDQFGPFSFGGHIIVFGQAGNDVINVSMPSRSAFVYGGRGDDLINTGNAGSILMGNDGNDTLNGGNASDLLIGGLGADWINGGNGSDILVSGKTTYDTNSTANRKALCSILDQWTHSGYTQGIDAIVDGGGRLNGAYVLDASTIVDDASVDHLSGGEGRDWYLLNLTGGTSTDIVSDATKNETLTDI